MTQSTEVIVASDRKLVRVTCEGLPDDFSVEAYSNGSHWNGFATPMFALEAGLALCKVAGTLLPLLHLPRLRRIDTSGCIAGQLFLLPPRAFLPVGMLALFFSIEAIMFKRIASLFVCCIIFAGCAAQPTSPKVYRGSEALRTGSAEVVTVVRVRQVTIADTDGVASANTGVPGVIGALVGGVLGARVIGNGNGRYLAGAMSGTVSAVLAQAAAKHMSRRDGVEVIVRKEDGRQIVVAQDADQRFQAGEQVYLVSGGGGYRLTR